MNANPNFRYYVAFGLILMLIMLMRVQVQPTGANEPVAQEANSAAYYAAGNGTSR